MCNNSIEPTAINNIDEGLYKIYSRNTAEYILSRKLLFGVAYIYCDSSRNNQIEINK